VRNPDPKHFRNSGSGPISRERGSATQDPSLEWANNSSLPPPGKDQHATDHPDIFKVRNNSKKKS
jgi:hypothetical protein